MWEQVATDSADAAHKLAAALAERDAAQRTLQGLKEKMRGAESARAELEADLKRLRAEQESTAKEALRHKTSAEDLHRQLADLAAASQVGKVLSPGPLFKPSDGVLSSIGKWGGVWWSEELHARFPMSSATAH